MTDFRHDFLAFALARDVLQFGQFVTKAGRKTPYFFNAGLFNDGESLRRLGSFYAEAYLASGIICMPPTPGSAVRGCTQSPFAPSNHVSEARRGSRRGES